MIEKEEGSKVLKTMQFRQGDRTLTLKQGDQFYRLERDDGFYREVRRARQDDNVLTPFLLRTERSIHPAELSSFQEGVWQAIFDSAA